EPEARRHDQPDYSCQDAAVVELANARNNQTQNSRQHWIAHRIFALRSGTSYVRRAGFVRSALAVDAPHVDDLATEGFQHRLDGRVTLRHLAQALFFLPRFVFATEWLAVGCGIFHDDPYAHVLAGNFTTRITHELVVVSLREHVPVVTRIRGKLDI